MTELLTLINAALVYLYGLFLTVSFAGGWKTRRERCLLGVLGAALLAAQVLCWHYYGFTVTWKLYPIISHLPIILMLTIGLKKPIGVSVTSMVTAYFCCQLPRWTATLFLALFGTEFAYQLSYMLVIVPIYLLLTHSFTAAAHRAMTYSKGSLLLFGGLPLFYYLYDYLTRVYTDILYEDIRLISEFLPAAMALFYVVFVTVYHREVQRRNKAELQSSLLEMQFEQATSELSAFRQIEEKTAAYRHDMRHHFAMLGGYLDSGETEKAIRYIRSATLDIDGITPTRYCENTALNLIVSSFSDKGAKLGVQLHVAACIPDNLPISETALCTLLSNGLENAIFAAAKLPDEKQRIVRLNCPAHKDKLLINIQNPYAGVLLFQDDLPISDRPGHGFGVKSIKLIVDRLGGLCSFDAADGLFTLKIMLPLNRTPTA